MIYLRLLTASIVLCLCTGIAIAYTRGITLQAQEQGYVQGLSVGSAEGFLRANAGRPIDCHKFVREPRYEAVVCRIWRVK